MVCGLDVCDEVNQCLSDVHVNDCWEDCTDEVTGVTLLRDVVAKARAEEMAWHEKGGGRNVCRWRDINKVDNERVEVRGRLVARDATPSKTGKRRQLTVLDVKRAFLHADAQTETYMKPPHLRDTELCWLLKKCVYATLPAAARWQHFVQKVGTDIGLLC